MISRVPPPRPAGMDPSDQWMPGSNNPGWGPGPLAGFGFWPVVELPTNFDPATQRTGAANPFVVDGLNKRVTFTRAVTNIPAAELLAAKRTEIIVQLQQTDAEFSPRWIEDLAAGHQYAAFTAWQTKRAGLRAQLAALTT